MASRSLTLDQMADKVIDRLSMESSNSAQVYAEPRIKIIIQQQFDLVFERKYWPQFSSWAAVATDASTGLPTSDFTSSPIIKEFGDIKGVWIDTEENPLPSIPSMLNPYTIGGTTARFVEPVDADASLFRIWPRESTDGLYIYYRSRPDEFEDATAINFDSDYLIYASCFDYLDDDGTNPGGADKFQALAETRLGILESKLSNNRVVFNPHQKTSQDEWRQI